ncbi:hypothetical protein LINPERHAP2_LOCUS42912 [Linum perenne]
MSLSFNRMPSRRQSSPDHESLHLLGCAAAEIRKSAGVCSAMKKLLSGLNRHPREGNVFYFIGEKRKRFEFPVGYVNCEGIGKLLRESEEYGYQLDYKIDGPIWIRSCTVEKFRRVLRDVEEEYRWRMLE